MNAAAGFAGSRRRGPTAFFGRAPCSMGRSKERSATSRLSLAFSSRRLPELAELVQSQGPRTSSARPINQDFRFLSELQFDKTTGWCGGGETVRETQKPKETDLLKAPRAKSSRTVPRAVALQGS
jgi:hypothetical protein